MNRKGAPDSVWRLLAKDRLLRFCTVGYGLLLTVVGFGIVAPERLPGDVHHLVDPALIVLTLFALLWGRRRIDRHERRFWDLLALAWACWLLVEGLFFFDVSLPLVSASFTTDTLYILFYLVFALALDLRPQVKPEQSPRSARRRLESVAGLSAAFGILIYFAIVVLPEPLGVSLSFVPRERGVTPLLAVRLSLDLILLGRLIYASYKNRVRWRRLYGLLATGMFFFALKDLLAILAFEGFPSPARLGLLYEFFLSLPTIFVILAARYRHLPDTEIAHERLGGDAEDDDKTFRTSPLVLYAVIVPILHFLLYPLNVLESGSRAAREVFSLAYVLTLGFMAWYHQSLIVKDNLRASRALRKAEARLFRSQRLESVGRLAGGIAHDFNNYLTVIRGYCEIVRDRLHEPEAVEEIGYVEDAADKATHLTRQLLAFGRRQVLRPEALDLNAVVRETGKLLESLLGEDVHLEIDLDPGIGYAQADLGQTEQVVMNLAINGRDAMPRGGTLSVRTRRVQLNAREAEAFELEAGSYASLTIADNGCGMTEDVQSKAFEPFFTTKGQGRGTGLGLSTVHGIMAQSGGAISLRSVVGEGTTVHVLFPTATGQTDPQERSAPRPHPGSSQATLLVVEDDDQIRNLAVRALTHAGFRVHDAPSGPAALERIRDYERIDMLITDVMMAHMDGVELADILVSQRPELRVLFTSGYPAETLRERQAVLPLAIQLLEKPFTTTDLVNKVQQVLAEPLPAGKRGRTLAGTDGSR